ncbi:MAG: 5-oxoprolinase subunit PxpB [Oscillospiraceae bacterium]|nr:5-oxoprolinase subunit PxpB [Oscillospiraceae bacterium]
MQDYKILVAGDSSVLIQFEQKIDPLINRRVAATVQLIREQHIPGLVDMIPTYCSLLINYDPRVILYDALVERLSQLMKMEIAADSGRKRVFEIPVCYGGELGPDLQIVADHANLSPEEVIRIHTSTDYLIYMLGFLPGFTYLGGLDEQIHTPRLPNPRLLIPAGSVGIGGSQTGIYPLDSPGGWNLIGRTPVKTYDPNRAVPILVEAGDYIRFVSIDRAEYDRILDLIERGEYTVPVHEKEA